MNERIQELWDQAAKSTAAYPSGQNNSWETQVNFMNKFAELLIRECAIIADTAQAEDMGWNIGEIIKEHFGVEQ